MGRRASPHDHEGVPLARSWHRDRYSSQLRHLLNTLREYSPPLDLLAKLDSSAPAMAKRAQLNARRKGWWDSNGLTKAGARARELFGGAGEVEEGLVRVLSGEEEIANLRTPKGIMITGPPGEWTRAGFMGRWR